MDEFHPIFFFAQLLTLETSTLQEKSGVFLGRLLICMHSGSLSFALGYSAECFTLSDAPLKIITLGVKRHTIYIKKENYEMVAAFLGSIHKSG